MRTIRFLFALLAMVIPASAFAQLHVSVQVGPPELPVYDQPICPEDGDLWTPGYWAYDDSVSDYYWVDGAWVAPPESGYLWTPGYWGWGDGGYFFPEGYWGLNVGFYGGINYGFGYYGAGYGGGRWRDGHFFYNRSVNHLDGDHFRNTYDERVERGGSNSRVSYNGGRGGIEVHANAQQESAARERHLPEVGAQAEHARAARGNPESRASVNHGRPGNAVATRSGEGAAAGREAESAPRMESGGRPADSRTAVHPKDLPAIERTGPANSGNVKADKKYEQQQGKLINKQTQERNSLQQKQENEHQQLTRQHASPARTQQVEQKHQQQTQQMSQRHTAQQQQMQSRQPQARSGGGRPR